MVDEWEIGPPDTSYDPDKLYTRGVDSRGHSAIVHLRVLPDVVSQIEKVVQSRALPYQTTQDVIRDAIVHRLHYLRQRLRRNNVDIAYARILNLHRVLEEEDRKQEQDALLGRLTNIVNNHLSRGEMGRAAAAQLVEDFISDAESLPESYWRSQLLAELRQRFGYLLEGEQ
jgi:hypothetical protein